MRYEPFILDYDGTYDIPDPDNDNFPTVYFVLEGTMDKVCQLADLASKTFQQVKNNRGIRFLRNYLLKTVQHFCMLEIYKSRFMNGRKII